MGFLLIASFFLLFMLGFPIVMAIAIPAVAYILLNNFPMDMIAQRMSYALYSFPLIAIPIFVFAGSLMNSTEITRRIFRFADTLVGRIHGGLAQVNCFASLIFAGMSGAALADVGGLGLVEIKAMEQKGFTTSFAAAVTVASSTVGPIFPPSIPLVLYGAVTGVSVTKLLLAGIIPGIFCTAMLMVMTVFIAKTKNLPRAERWPTLSDIFKSLIPALPALLAPVILISGMVLGFFTPTEAAAITVAYIIIISTLFYRNFTFKGLLSSTLETIKASAGILLIVSAASLFGWILAIERIPEYFTKWIHAFSQNPLALLLFLNIFFLIVGMFLDSTTATLLLVPIIAPPIVSAGVDPVHLGIVIIFNLMIGIITPPMGLALFLVSDITKVPILNILRDVWPYFLPLLFTLFVITYIPQLSLWIPSFLK
jgi:tripartite ATP-independent transporter DctM subunit